jgi:LEA14-like dessication related protein
MVSTKDLSMKFRNILIGAAIVLIGAASCKTLMSYVNVAKCDFRMESLKDPRVAGIDVSRINSFSDLNFMQVGKISTSYLSGNIPLEFTLNLEGKNPNTAEARMAQFDWIVKIDDVQITTGTNEQEYAIPANDGTVIMPLKISVNLLDVLSNEAKDALLNFGLNLADASGTPTRVSMQIKPTINVGGVPITYPGYINLGTAFGTKE